MGCELSKQIKFKSKWVLNRFLLKAHMPAQAHIFTLYFCFTSKFKFTVWKNDKRRPKWIYFQKWKNRCNSIQSFDWKSMKRTTSPIIKVKQAAIQTYLHVYLMWISHCKIINKRAKMLGRKEELHCTIIHSRNFILTYYFFPIRISPKGILMCDWESI